MKSVPPSTSYINIVERALGMLVVELVGAQHDANSAALVRGNLTAMRQMT